MSTNKLSSLQERFSSAGRKHLTEIFPQTHISNTLPPLIPPKNADPPNKRLRLQALLTQAQSQVQNSPRRGSPQRETRIMEGGWYHTGFPPQTVYRVEDLVSYWRACMAQHFRQDTPPLQFPFYLRPKILDWLKSDGHQVCEHVVGYGVRMWEAIKSDFEIEAEYPTMNILWGFRRGIYRRSQQTGEKRRWGGFWNGESETDYQEEIS